MRQVLHIIPILTTSALFLILLLTPAKRYLYLELNKIALNLGINSNNIASDEYVNWIKNQSDKFESNQGAVFLNKKIEVVRSAANFNSKILGQNESTLKEKWIEVDISDQKLYLKQNGNTVGTFLVSTGKWYPTPRGQWKIWSKLRFTRMKGGSKALGTYYDLPNVPYTMYYDKGYGIHGAYWHNNFGQPMSHGCVNMKPEEAGVVFNWANVGTQVIIHD